MPQSKFSKTVPAKTAVGSPRCLKSKDVFADIIQKAKKAQQELKDLNLINPTSKICMDFDTYSLTADHHEKDKLLSDISTQNTWFAKNIINQM